MGTSGDSLYKLLYYYCLRFQRETTESKERNNGN